MLSKEYERFLSELYDKLYDIAKEYLSIMNPCKIKDGKCARGNFCCDGCRHLSKNGCTIKALWCKLWLCGQFYDDKYNNLRGRLIALTRIANEYGLLQYRMSKDETFNRLRNTPKYMHKHLYMWD